MKREEFAATVRRLEAFAAGHPRAYHRRVALFALLGYAYVALVLTGLIGLLVLLVLLVFEAHATGYLAGKVGLAVLTLIVLVVRALWVRLPPPGGRLLSRPEAPGLFDLIDDVVARCKAPKPNRVLLTGEFNAAITQRPRRAFFGRTVNYLIIGLPMLQAVTADELRAILAHECGHLSGRHSIAGAWIYRLRTGWSRLAEALAAERHWGRVLFLRFFRWYAPYFAAYSFVAAREQEYAADRMSAAIASPALAGQALVRVALTGRRLGQKYWPAIRATVRTSPTPPAGTFARFRESLREPLAPDGDSWLGEALNEKTSVADTHPCLADRLSALGVPPVAPPPLERSASDDLLVQGGVPLIAELDAEWQSAAAESWQKRHAEYCAATTKHAALLASEAAGELPMEGRRELAGLEETVGDPQRARERYEALLADLPDDAAINFAVGRLRLSRGEESGVELLRRAVRLDAEATPAVTHVLAPWLEARRETAALHDLLDQYDAFRARARSAPRERKSEMHELLDQQNAPPADAPGDGHAWINRGRARRRMLAVGTLALVAITAAAISILRSPGAPSEILVSPVTKTFWGIRLGDTRAHVEQVKGKPEDLRDGVSRYALGDGDPPALIEISYRKGDEPSRDRVAAIYYQGPGSTAPPELPFVIGAMGEQLTDAYNQPVWTSVPDEHSEFEMFSSGLTAYLWHRQVKKYGIQDFYRER